MRVLKTLLSRFRCDKGFTLLEAVLILVVMAVLSYPLTRLSIVNNKSVAKGLFISEMVNYAQGSIEEIIETGSRNRAGWNNITSGYSFYLSSDLLPEDVSRNLSVTVDSLNGVVYKEVTVVISHNQVSNDVGVSTVITRPSS